MPTSTRPSLAEIDEALAHASATLKRAELTGTHADVAEAKRTLDVLLDRRSARRR